MQAAKPPVTAESGAKIIYSRSEHPISRSQISEQALKVLYQLKKSGFDAYLVGGCVRDLLLGREPKDFDVATDATPEQLKRIFRNCRLIGRRFRLAHIYFGKDYIEVATFRAGADAKTDQQIVHESGQLIRDNVYGSLEEDVWRRDFSINALYYNIRDFSVLDHTGGMLDLKNGVLRLIGNPETRYREDPVRMLRAVRFAVKLGFILEPNTERPLINLAHLLNAIPAARLYEEFLKLFLSGYGLQTFEMLRHYGLFAVLFPATERSLNEENEDFPKLLLIRALENSDRRIEENLPVAPYFLLSVMLWDAVQTAANQEIAQGHPPGPAFQLAASTVINEQVKKIAFPKHVGIAMREVWFLQSRFHHRTGSRPFKILSHPRFRAAFDFLMLRAATGGVDQTVADWWHAFHQADAQQQAIMTKPGYQAANASTGTGKRRKRNNHRHRNKAFKPASVGND